MLETSSPVNMPTSAHTNSNIRPSARFSAAMRGISVGRESSPARCNERTQDCRKRIRFSHSGRRTRAPGERWESAGKSHHGTRAVLIVLQQYGQRRSSPPCHLACLLDLSANSPHEIQHLQNPRTYISGDADRERHDCPPTPSTPAAPEWLFLLLVLPAKTRSPSPDFDAAHTIPEPGTPTRRPADQPAPKNSAQKTPDKSLLISCSRPPRSNSKRSSRGETNRLTRTQPSTTWRSASPIDFCRRVSSLAPARP